jgi:predicted RNA methylase
MSFEIHSEADLEAAAAAAIAGGRARARLRRSLEVGHDPLAAALASLRDPETRRANGAIYTPLAVVEAMVSRAVELCGAAPGQIVDPGAGTGRFLLAAARAFPRAELVGVEIDPLAATCARANLAAAGLANRARIEVCDFRRVELGGRGPRLFIGNPPYVRHHQISAADKTWLSERAAALGVRSSALAGLHIHFVAAIAALSEPGDAGVLITAAEWLDAGYGAAARELFAGRLGLVDLAIFDADAPVFADAMTTACVSTFAVGHRVPVTARRVRRAADLLAGPGRAVDRSELAGDRWSGLPEPPAARAVGSVELGVSFRVHRGQATGANSVWIAGDDTPPLPGRFLVPAITRASELFAAGPVLDSVDHLRRVIALPPDLDELDPAERVQVDAFLEWAAGRGADQSYLARHRNPWWSVKLKVPAPILATYMARRPPAFVRNLAGARHLNIAHGIYPTAPCSDEALDGLARALRAQTTTADGRTYAGGLVKFEPRDMERLLVPALDALARFPDAGAARPS